MPIIPQNKKISQFNTLTNPTGNAEFPVVIPGEVNNYKLSLSGLSTFINIDVLNTLLTGYINGVNEPITSENSILTAFENLQSQIKANTTKHWESNVNKVLDSSETLVISGNYVLSGCNLTLNTDNVNINVSGIDFNKYAQIFIGGNFLVIDSNIVNNGMISVNGALILSGNTTITGSGIII